MQRQLRPDDLAAQRRRKKLAQCKHWNGALGPKPCEVGVDLVKLIGPRVQSGWLKAIPCVLNDAPAFVCEHKITPSLEEVEAGEREGQAAVALTIAVMAAIPAGGPGSHGTVPCPKCGGTVHWQRSIYNSHLRAMCKAGCVNFME